MNPIPIFRLPTSLWICEVFVSACEDEEDARLMNGCSLGAKNLVILVNGLLLVTLLSASD